MSVLKQQYNELLKRFLAGTKYLDNNEIPIAEREKWLPEYEKIRAEMEQILSQVEHTEDNILRGF
jgi:hypothetical protein